MAPPATDAATTKQEQQHAAGGEGVEVSGHNLRLVAECGTEVRLSRSAARMSTMLLDMIEAGCAGAGIPIKGADAGTLRLVAAYCEKHAPHYDPVASAARLRAPFPLFPIDFTPATYAVKPVTQLDPDPHGLEAWDRKFISDLPDNSAQPHHRCQLNGHRGAGRPGLHGRSGQDEGQDAWRDPRCLGHIENDYTPEQEAEVRRENAWAFED